MQWTVAGRAKGLRLNGAEHLSRPPAAHYITATNTAQDDLQEDPETLSRGGPQDCKLKVVGVVPVEKAKIYHSKIR